MDWCTIDVVVADTFTADQMARAAIYYGAADTATATVGFAFLMDAATTSGSVACTAKTVDIATKVVSAATGDNAWAATECATLDADTEWASTITSPAHATTGATGVFEVTAERTTSSPFTDMDSASTLTGEVSQGASVAIDADLIAATGEFASPTWVDMCS